MNRSSPTSVDTSTFRDLRCPTCARRLFFRHDGPLSGVIEAKCASCGAFSVVQITTAAPYHKLLAASARGDGKRSFL